MIPRSKTVVDIVKKGSFAVLNGDVDTKDSTVNDRLDQIGFGFYQQFMVVALGIYMISGSIEMGAVAPLHTGLAQSFNMSTWDRSLLAACTYLGCMVGMLISGPLSDYLGRRGILIYSNVCSFSTSVVLAALPLMTPVKVILFLRVLAGIFSAVGGPAAVALAVESSSSMSRVNIMFALSFLHSLGYLCEAFGVLFFMPQMGEGPHDSWRSLSVFISLPSVVCVPLVCILRESPSLLAVKGRVAECIEALETIAIWNGQPTLSMVGVSPQFSEAPSSSSDGMLLFDTLSCMLKSYMHLVVLLTIVDSSRSFFMSGSAYLCKDLIMLSHSNVAPSIMNLVVNATPLIGVMLGSRFAFLGVRRINFMFSTLAAFAFLVLSSATMRQHPFILLTSMLVFKLSYGPISTCVSLMIIEAFPTEIRTTAYSVVAIVGKLLCMLGPILVESLKEGERADSWPDNLLRLYLMALAFAALSSGCLSLLLPAKVGNGRKLQDYVITRNGQIINMLDEDDMFFLLKDDRYRSKGQRRISTYGATLQDTVARGLAALAIKEGSYEASGSSSSCDEST